MPKRLNQTFQKEIIEWIETSLSITAIWDKQSEQRPDLPYASLNIISGPSLIGVPEAIHKTTNIFTWIFRQIFTTSIKIFSLNQSLDLAAQLMQSVFLPSRRAILEAAGLAIWNDSEIVITDISSLVNTGYESIASMDVIFNYAEEIDSPDGEIAIAEIKGVPGGPLERIDFTVDSTP